jgi:malic enzyme
MAEVDKEAIEKQVMALRLAGTAEVRIAEQLGISRHQVRKITHSKEYKLALKDLADKALEDAQNAFKSKLEELRPLAYEALRHNLELKKMDAVKTYVEIIGLKEQREVEKQDTNLTIVMPGANPNEKVVQTIEVTDVETE